MSEHELKTTEEAAAYVRRSPGTLENWRYQGKGPAYIGGGHGNPVLYRVSDLDAWLDAHRTDPSKRAA